MIYLASDIHLGLKFGQKSPLEREKIFCKFLDQIKPTATEIFLVGDIFDFWFEWKHTAPQGFTRTLGRLSEMTDQGIKIHLLTGNHDLWLRDYLQTECGLITHKNDLIITRHHKKLYITHSDKFYRQKGLSWIIDKLFRSRSAQTFARKFIHPDTLSRFGKNWSQANRHKKKEVIAHTFTGESDNWTTQCRKILAHQPDINYFVLGHLHIALDYPLSPSCRMVVLGEWIAEPTYATLDPTGALTLHKFTP